MILSALIFSQLVVLLALLLLIRRGNKPRPTIRQWLARAKGWVKMWCYYTLTYEPFPPTHLDPLRRRAFMTREERIANGLPADPVKGKWYQRPRCTIWA